ncbi:DnaJ-class molecular chaperone with C-terminal Zn finger domain [Halovivax ruber XH-70]|uniref:DnaJ-class molecular chaperone with C-terminal Zn finger domain n=1 Tax=Halovivax ruber (strain DSM 18193 / JCM 13892 / XH-70) TaxID=797302 RepID=L0IB35_HALRX|nr:J domain-containing protein [Halovivax ruber]AGB16033.1 DnaJ-class molecular chaperone with C-terminal Zn finger domain [Halovivax ruber XH-70]
MTEDFYDLLDVPPDASQDEIKAAFREQVRIYHPDLNDDERARAQFTALKTAYDVLGDPVERRAYDRLGHLDYVAKRTSGLPSPDKWSAPSDDASADDSDADDRSTVRSETGSWSAHGKTTGAASGATSTGTTDGGHARTETGTTWGPDDATARGSGLTGTGAVGRLLRWWHSLNLAGPLLWIGTALYVFGLAQYGRENAAAIDSLWDAIRAAGTDVDAISQALTSGTHGLDRALTYVQHVELVTPPVAGGLWLALLAGAFVAVCGILVGWRYRTRGELLGPITIDETIVLAVALGTVSALYGGVLLASALLLPLLYGVVLYHTKRLPGWSPSYAYLLAVAAPVCGLLAGWFELTTLPIELLAFVVIPLVGAIGLPIRFAVRRRLGV